MAGKDERLEVEQDIAFQKRDWTFERAGWVVILIAVIAALTGLFGRGPLSDAQAESADRSVRVSYARFERHGAPAELALTLLRRGVADTSVWVWIDRHFIDGIEIDRVTPEPLSERSNSSHAMFEIAFVPGSDSARATFRFTPDKIGARTFQLGVAGGQPVRMSQFIYP